MKKAELEQNKGTKSTPPPVMPLLPETDKSKEIASIFTRTNTPEKGQLTPHSADPLENWQEDY